MWANERIHTHFRDRIYWFGCESFKADRMGQGDTLLHYLAVQQAMVSVHRSNTNLLAYLGKLTTVHPGEGLSRHY